MNGQPFKVVKYPTDITADKLRRAGHEGQIDAIHKSHAVITFDMNGTFLDANKIFLDAVGYRLEEVEGRHHRMFVEPSFAHGPEYASFWNDLLEGRHRAGEYRRLGKNGRELWLQASYNPIHDLNGKPFKVVKYATVITREKLRQADHQGQIASIHKAQCVVSFELDGTVIDANDNFLDATGYRLAEVRGRHHRMFVDDATARSADYLSFWGDLAKGLHKADEFRRRCKDGREIWLQASYNPIFDMNGRPFKVVKYATDVTRERLRQIDNDGQIAAIHKSQCVVAFDMDIGGDEFVVAAPDLTDEQIDALCRRLIGVVQASILHDKCMLTVGLSIGVAVSPHDATTAEDLLRCADVALYRTKGNGRGSYSFFATDMDEKRSANRHLAEEMRHGIQAGQFFLDYQPRFDAQTGQVRNALVVVRWAHPANGRLEPADFIALAEKSGLIVPLGEWVLRTACHAAAAWPDIGVSVNVSPIQFAGTDFPQVVASVLTESGLAPERLALEMTERMLIDDPARARSGLEALKALGVRLILDDHGSHHASLASVRAFPFDAVKIDRRFIADIEGGAGGRRIAREILLLSQALAMPVTPHGVESTGELLMLRLDDGGEVQGFILARALSADALSALLKRQRLDAALQFPSPPEEAATARPAAVNGAAAAGASSRSMRTGRRAKDRSVIAALD